MKKFWIFVLLLTIPFAFFACNKNLNKLNTPKNLQVEAGGIITFQRVEDDEFYNIQINDNSFKISLNSKGVELYNQNNINYLRFDGFSLFSFNNTYKIKVQACAKNRKDSDFSNEITYTHTAQLATPKNAKIDGNNLRWGVVNFADYYVVNISIATNKGTKEYSEKVLQNNLNISKYLLEAGSCTFAIQAKSYNTGYPDSAACYVEITNSRKLATPTLFEIYETASELHALLVVDENANLLTINVNGSEKSFGFASLTDCLQPIENENVLGDVDGEFIDNFYELNLTKLLTKFNTSNVISISVRADYHPSDGKLIYTKSEPSQIKTYQKLNKLSAPEIEFSEGEISWNNTEKELNGGYKIYVARASGLETYSVFSEVDSFIVDDDYLAVGVQAIGKGESDNSNLSNLIVKEAESQTDFSVMQNEQIVSWSRADDGGYFIVELDNTIFKTTEKSINLTNYSLRFNTIRVTAINQNKTPISRTLELDYDIHPIKLPSPDIEPNAGTLELKFTNLTQAIGYYVYYKHSADDAFTKINHLFTSNSIDLSNYLKTNGEYEVKVQAAADKFGIYADSEIESAPSSTFAIKAPLKTPTFAEDFVIKKDEKYYLCFNSVENATNYEISIKNRKPILVPASSQGEYQVDITNQLTTVGEYSIKLRALPDENSKAFSASEYATANYVLRLKLDDVKDLEINQETLMLSFSAVQNAEEYRVRIEKAGDENYTQELNKLNLANPFSIKKTNEDISQYILGSGSYYFYVTAIAEENSYFENSNEVGRALVAKAQLSAPEIIDKLNNSEAVYNLYISETANAESYSVQITLPNGSVQEISTLTATINISEYLTTQGVYKFRVKANANANGDYLSSDYGEEYVLDYRYTNQWDFRRYKVFYNGKEISFELSSVQQFRDLLFYHYLFGVDEDYGLTIYLITNGESVNSIIDKFASTATQNNIYNFDEDNDYISAKQRADAQELFEIMSKKLLSTYPDINMLNFISCQANNNIFTLKFKNEIQVQSGDYPTYLAADYATKFNYIPLSERRGAGFSFAIDNCLEMQVNSSEQLLQAVLSGRKPKITTDKVQEIYSNARAVLRAIITPNMNDTTKVTRIFDWLEYALSNNYYATMVGESEIGSLQEYGGRADFYLEGVFLNLLNEQNANFDGEFYLNKRATSYSYAKAFALLCGIEGVKAELVFGTNQQKLTTVWNKVYIENCWYVVDIFSSDNLIAPDLKNCKDIATHLYFLVSDDFHEKSGLVSPSTDCQTNYNYYANNTFNLTSSQILDIIGVEAEGFTYLRQFAQSTKYQNYNQTIDDDTPTTLQAFLLNALIYSAAQGNENGAVFELRSGVQIEEDLPKVAAVLNTLTNKQFKAEILNTVSALENGRTTYTYILCLQLVKSE